MLEIDPPLWALDKAALGAGYSDWQCLNSNWNSGAAVVMSVRAHARYIASHEPERVDPDVAAVERILAAFFDCTVDDAHLWPAAVERALAQYKLERGA